MVQTFPDGAENFQQDGDTIGTGPTRSWMVKTLLLLFSLFSEEIVLFANSSSAASSWSLKEGKDLPSC